ncbi:Mannose-specific lectin [Carex littledalei]|uniref:non-specific serine/threonine protein kinase n=1 Tax=Carex littledalei TaxID=544730 RepID=A0A833RW75_9POAL|nr:Mannose-specific lectin [Carex littledalei]
MVSISPLFTSLLILSIFLSPFSVFGETLLEGQSLTYGSYKLTMQRDCNLVLYDDGMAEWSQTTEAPVALLGCRQTAILCNMTATTGFYGPVTLIGERELYFGSPKGP